MLVSGHSDPHRFHVRSSQIPPIQPLVALESYPEDVKTQQLPHSTCCPTRCLPGFCTGVARIHGINSLVIAFMGVQLYPCVSKFISQSADLLLEDENYSSSCREHTRKHLSLWCLNRRYILEKFCFLSQRKTKPLLTQ